jgi:hypothetical protein
VLPSLQCLLLCTLHAVTGSCVGILHEYRTLVVNWLLHAYRVAKMSYQTQRAAFWECVTSVLFSHQCLLLCTLHAVMIVRLWPQAVATASEQSIHGLVGLALVMHDAPQVALGGNMQCDACLLQKPHACHIAR